MEKLYVECANRIKAAIAARDVKLNEYREAVAMISANEKLSDIGKKDLRDEIIKEIEKLNAEATENVKAAVKDFRKEYTIEVKTDGKDHQSDIANALKVIEMCGAGLTGDLLRGVLEPIKNDYPSMKIIKDVLEIRFYKAIETADSYSEEIRKIVFEYIGTNVEIDEFNSRMKAVEDAVNAEIVPVLFETSIYSRTTSHENTVWEITDRTGYTVYNMIDDILAVGKMYEELAEKYPLLFKKHIPTNEEIVMNNLA